MTKSTKTLEVRFRRRAEEKTNYRKRIAALKSLKPRLVVRKSPKYITGQVVRHEQQGDVIVASANSKELRKFGWALHCGNIPSAYLTGLLCGTRAVRAGVGEAILDIGLNTPVHGSSVFAALKGAIDAGLSIPADETVFPGEERISGRHIAAYASSLGKAEFEKRFSSCIKAGAEPKSAEDYFKKAKEEISKKEKAKAGVKNG